MSRRSVATVRAGWAIIMCEIVASFMTSAQTRAQIVRSTNRNTSTVYRVVDELHASGLLYVIRYDRVMMGIARKWIAVYAWQPRPFHFKDAIEPI